MNIIANDALQNNPSLIIVNYGNEQFTLNKLEPGFDHTQTLPKYIYRLAYNVLTVLKDDHEKFGYSQRNHEELAKRFNVHPVTIRKAYSYLNQIGFAISKARGKGRPSKRWITPEGYTFLANELLHYKLHYQSATPYIYLSKEKETDLNLIEEQQGCEQNDLIEDTYHDLEPKERIERLFDEHQIPLDHKISIRNAFNRSHLSEGRKKELLHRLDRAFKNHGLRLNLGRIGNYRSYMLTALANEEKKQVNLTKYFKEKGIFSVINMQC